MVATQEICFTLRVCRVAKATDVVSALDEAHAS
jgi:hypothetical protein